MKRKITLSVLLVVILLATAVLSASSMQYGNIDAYWGYVDAGGPNPGATCLRYADGPSGIELDPDDGIRQSLPLSFTNPQIQNGNTTNWNQVRYGVPLGYLSCTHETNQLHFKAQSGLAFNGVNEMNPRASVGAMTPFALGKFCHVNKVILVRDIGITPYNALEMTTTHLNIKNVDCGPGMTLVKDKDGTPFDPPVTSIDLEYSFPVQFDETPNEGTCRYPSKKPCADAIIPGQAQGQHFFCKVTAEDVSVSKIDRFRIREKETDKKESSCHN